MMSEAIQFLTPVGRLVQGDCWKANTTDQQGNPLIHKSGPNTGQPRVNYYVGIAVPKTDPGFAELWAKMQQAAQEGFPAGQYNNPGFSWKMIDGDGLDAQGQPYANREGHAGCWIVRLSSGFAPQVYLMLLLELPNNFELE